MTDEQFPVGGSRQAVFDALRQRGFTQSIFSDKHWTSRDGLTAHIYGTGSMLVVRKGDTLICDCKMAEALEKIDAIGATEAGQ